MADSLDTVLEAYIAAFNTALKSTDDREVKRAIQSLKDLGMLRDKLKTKRGKMSVDQAIQQAIEEISLRSVDRAERLRSIIGGSDA